MQLCGVCMLVLLLSDAFWNNPRFSIGTSLTSFLVLFANQLQKQASSNLCGIWPTLKHRVYVWCVGDRVLYSCTTVWQTTTRTTVDMSSHGATISSVVRTSATPVWKEVTVRRSLETTPLVRRMLRAVPSLTACLTVTNHSILIPVFCFVPPFHAVWLCLRIFSVHPAFRQGRSQKFVLGGIKVFLGV